RRPTAATDRHRQLARTASPASRRPGTGPAALAGRLARPARRLPEPDGLPGGLRLHPLPRRVPRAGQRVPADAAGACLGPARGRHPPRVDLLRRRLRRPFSPRGAGRAPARRSPTMVVRRARHRARRRGAARRPGRDRHTRRDGRLRAQRRHPPARRPGAIAGRLRLRPLAGGARGRSPTHCAARGHGRRSAGSAMNSPTLPARRDGIAGIAFLPLLLLWPALRHVIESRMLLHMLVEFPALLAAGWAARRMCPGSGPMRALSLACRHLDWRGWTGATLLSAVTAVWMIPTLLDLALLTPAVAAAKYCAWWLAGWTI